ncbi:hypothetical protein [Streptomyces sp. NBRC 110028]|uniref:hypothetical protein n=1 Tax=Streptomyces sp. NBRC 110028 TaxID=1621260 RepID=UPI00351C1982
MLYKVTRKLLTVPSVLLRRGTAKDAELLVLPHENAVLRLKGVNIPIRLLSWAFPVDGEATGVAWCGTR